MMRNEETISYEVIRSGRKTSAIEVKRDGTVVVRCPMWVADREIGEFVEKHRSWIMEHRAKVLQQLEKRTVYTQDQVKEFRQHARWMLAQKTWQWAENAGDLRQADHPAAGDQVGKLQRQREFEL